MVADLPGQELMARTLPAPAPPDKAEQARDQAHRVRDTARSYAERAEAVGRDAAETAGGRIEANPFASVLTAFGVGVLAGKLLDARR